jgi:inhibitor of cysteine peptidase
MQKLLFTLITLFLFSLAWFAYAQNIPVYQDTKQTISVFSKRPQFIIKLKSNPTTGYSWFLEPYNTSAIKLLKRQFIPAKQKLIGAGGFEQWTFQLHPSAFIAPQSLIISLVYKRPWEKAENPLTLHFKINPALDTL